MVEASFAPKLEGIDDGIDDNDGLVAAGAAAATAGMRVESTRIGVPQGSIALDAPMARTLTWCCRVSGAVCNFRELREVGDVR